MSPLEQRVAALEAQLKALTSNTTIPFEINKAFAARLGITNLQEKLFNGGDLVSNYVQPVDEGGSATYNVPLEPDYILRFKYRNFEVAIPAYDI